MANESPIEQAMSYFLRNYRYTKDRLAFDYQAELSKYSDSTWEAPQRAARLSAAVKRYKTYEMLCFIFKIARETELDFTPLVVKRLCNSLFGRQGSQSIIVDIFGQKGRAHRSNDSSPNIIEEATAKYRSPAQIHWVNTLNNIEKVKRGYRTKIRTTKKLKC
ncbi:cytoplasmic protein [Xenorhabdus sp. XENO-1]|uniref:cytoplasmic protein n=1 Tax=Xenorhabdus bovienii TaxID=40576 RepID=UPI0020CA462B|nr:cytoplasmic protein [Xenorhabdus bovienii]MCP9269162.1 cytoplasmic protein [Xenorhabdus bovienii subsp. africana]